MKILKNKKSFVVIFVFFFWAIYTVTNISLFIISVDEVFYKDQVRHEQRIAYHTDAALSMILNKQFNLLKDNLNEALKLGQFDFAILMIEGQEPFVVSDTKSVELAKSYEPTDGVQVQGNFIYRTIKIAGNTLTIGTYHEKNLFIQSYLQFYFFKLVFDIFLVTLLSGILIYTVMRDLLKLTNMFQKSGLRDFKNSNINANSLEAQILLSATQSYDDLSKNLSQQVSSFALSLGSAITSELRRGTPAPSTFEAVLVRMDLNHYTQKYLSTDLFQMSKTLNLFFETARTIVERYDGLIYEYIGDEILFFFKVKTSMDETYKLSFACVKDIFEEMDFYKNQSTEKENFSVKASICKGELHFVKLDLGHSFSGIPLIQTARMLSFITEKNKNSLIIEEKEKNLVLEFVESFKTQSALLKGFASEFSLLEVNDFKKFNQVNSPANTIANAQESSSQSLIENPIYHRSTQALANTFLNLREVALPAGDVGLIMNTLAALRGVSFGKPQSEIYTQFCAFMRELFRTTQDIRTLSSIISLSRNFDSRVLPVEFSVLKGLLEEGLKHTNPRVRANSVIALSHFDPQMDVKLSPSDKSSNRLFADILFVLGKKAMDKTLIKEINFIVNHPEKNYRSSGLYLCSALLQYHLEKDYVYYQSNPHFKTLRAILKKSLEITDADLNKHARIFQDITGETL